MRVQPFLLLGASTLTGVAVHIMSAVEAWRTEWGLTGLAVEVECLRAWETLPLLRSVPWQSGFVFDGKSAWLACQPELARVIQRQLFPSDQHNPVQLQTRPSIASEGGHAAVQALFNRIAAAVALISDHVALNESASPQQSAFSFASGSLLARIKLGEQTVSCLLDHACTRALTEHIVPTPRAPIPHGLFNKGLARIPVTLPVEIGQAEVDVASLLTLTVGDVIRLGTSVDQPLTVFGPRREALFDAHLGTLHGAVALEVVRSSNFPV